MSVKAITKGYFFGAMAISAIHTVHSFEKMGLHTGEQWITPLAVDGLAFFGLALSSSKYEDSTNKIGRRIQIAAAALQLASNLYAASSVGGMVLGGLIVGVYLLAEAVSPRIKTRAQAEAELAAKIEAEMAAQAEAEVQAKKDATNAAARARRQNKKAETQALENMLNRKPRGRNAEVPAAA